MSWQNGVRKLINLDIMKVRPGFILQNKLKISVGLMTPILSLSSLVHLRHLNAHRE